MDGGETLRNLTYLFIGLLMIIFQSASHAATYIVNGAVPAADGAQIGEDLKMLEPSGANTVFTDFPTGYQITYPSHMNVDVSLSSIRTVFSDHKKVIEVYYDNFSNTDTTARDYVHYGRHFTENTKDHTILLNHDFLRNGYKVHLLKWVRRPLSRLAIDRRYYATAEIIKNEREVYTVFIKSVEPITDDMKIIDSFRIIDKRGTAGTYLPLGQANPVLNRETREFYATYFSDSSPLRWGIFQPEAPEVMYHLQKIENSLGYRFPFVVRYQQLGDDVPLLGLNLAYADKKYVELTMQTFYYNKDNFSVMYDILDGKYDEYLRQYAKDLKQFSHPVLFRLNNEMNGDWCWYSSFHTAKDTEIYKAVWHYLHNLFEQEGVDNVLWVWNPHDRSFPKFSWNNYLAYYPGDDVVDIVGITGYNTGNYFPGETWREFIDIYLPIYQQYTNVFNKPLMITEFGANSYGGNKVEWIKRMFKEIKQFDRIKVAIWWSGVDWDSNGRAGRIYRLDENDATMQAFQEGLKSYQQ